ncbi:hypothetical protein J1N35_022612 [Gossypium stocksii]|uniref:Uncharacterized protein n=1 Tax=Gossypium stocksii TaxID=47602 RepID=A0A9D4A1B0_9ROSI|nr:hypothetical protein J1N35_022612 [Gossypium stocksii]
MVSADLVKGWELNGSFDRGCHSLLKQKSWVPNWPNKDCGFWNIYIMEASDNQTKGGRGRVSTGSALAVSTPKFKQRRVPAVRDFPLGCGRVTMSNYGLTRQITVDHHIEGK